MMAHLRELGTTLIELLVVLLLLGLLTAISAISMTSLRETETDTRVHALRRTRAQAIQNGASVLVHTDSAWTRFLPDGQTLRGGPYISDSSKAGR